MLVRRASGGTMMGARALLGVIFSLVFSLTVLDGATVHVSPDEAATAYHTIQDGA